MRILLRTSNKPQSMQISNGTPLLPLLVQLLRLEVHLRGRGEEEGGRGGPWAHFLLGELVSTTPRGPIFIGEACFNNPPGPIFYWGSLVPQNGGDGTLNCESASVRHLQILRNNSYLSDSDRYEWYLRFVFAEIVDQRGW